MTFKDHFDAAKKMPAYYEDVKSEGTPVERHLTEEERNVVSWSKAQVQTIIFRLCAELDRHRTMSVCELAAVLENASLNDFMTHWEGRALKAERESEEQRSRAERIDRNATAVVTQLKADLAAAQLREKGLREALVSTTCACTGMMTASGNTTNVCKRCAALANKEEK